MEILSPVEAQVRQWHLRSDLVEILKGSAIANKIADLTVANG
jgi:hypothetical protein